METKELQERLRRFYDGLSSPEEEKELIRYFSREDVPEEYRAEKDLFTYLSGQHPGESTAGIEKKMSQYVDTLSGKGQWGRRMSPLYTWIAGAAATIAILVVAYLGFIRSPVRDTYTDPALAYAETQKALLYVSRNLNRGTSKMGLLATAEEPMQVLQKLQMLNKPAEELKRLDEFNKGLKIVQNTPGLNKTRELMSKYFKFSDTK